MNVAWLHIFFRLVNFGIFIGFVVYIYQRFIKERVAQQMEQERRVVDGLRSERDAVVRICNEYKEVVASKAERREQMQKNIIQWRQTVIQNNEKRLVEKNNITQAVVNKSDRQRELLRVDLMRRSVIPEAVARARAELERAFSNEQEGIDFIQCIIARLPESKS